MGTTTVNVENNLATDLVLATTVNPELSTDYWGVNMNDDGAGQNPAILWMSRTDGITDGDTWIFTTEFTLAGIQVQLQEQVTGTLLGSDINIQVTANGQSSGWSPNNNVSMSFTGNDGNVYQVRGAYVSETLDYDNVQFSVSDVVLPQIKNIVVLMMENRSLDNVLGWIYSKENPPAQNIPAQTPPTYNGLAPNQHSNVDPNVNNGAQVYATEGTTQWTVNGETVDPTFVPTPDPGEIFNDVALQISNNMQGFLTNYLSQINSANGPADSAAQIMQSYSPDQVPVLSALATGFAVSDAWYASVPSQTWPNRGFLLAGSSHGNTNDTHLPWDINTIFDVLSNQNINWMVYNDGLFLSLTKLMFDQYWFNETNFGSIQDFQLACKNGTLPPFTFLEPSFGADPDEIDESYHPPYDITPAESFLAEIYAYLAQSPSRDQILFVVLFDEHGGTYDHMEPPRNAQPPLPDPVATDGSGYTFNTFGVRVPAIVVSSYVTQGTVFRSTTNVPYDHTSLLATVRDWLGLGDIFASMLPSPRIAAAPNLVSVLNQKKTPTAWPEVPFMAKQVRTGASSKRLSDDTPLNDIQRAVLVATKAKVDKRKPTKADYEIAKVQLRTHGDARRWVAAVKSHLPVK